LNSKTILACALAFFLLVVLVSASGWHPPDGPFVTMLEVDGIATAGFSANPVIFSSFTGIIETRSGGAIVTVKSPALTTYNDLVLSFPLSDEGEFLEWYNEPSGPDKARNAALVVLDGSRTEIRRYNFRDLVPVSRSLAESGGEDVAVYVFEYEEFELS